MAQNNISAKVNNNVKEGKATTTATTTKHKQANNQTN